MGVHRYGLMWSLLVAVMLTIVPRYWELRIDSIPALPPVQNPAFSEPEPIEVLEGRIARNTTLVATLVNYDVPVTIAHQVSDLVRPVFDLRRLRFGNLFRIEKETDGTLKAFEYKIDDERILKVEKGGGTYEAKVETLTFEPRESFVSAEIESSLFAALEDVPKGETLAMELAELFAWDLDFNSDVQRGDEIRIVVEDQYHDGEFVKHGRILAAEFVNSGKSYKAFRFGDEYYDAAGASLRRAFLKSPLKFTRVSSGFTSRRLHPILGTFRAHLAVDYAAPSGSPVIAVASGKVVKAGWSGGLGRYVEIQHANGLRSGYAHLSSIAKGVRSGTGLRQGEAVGAVGRTGLATGPHLHFVMMRNGRPINPLSIKSEPAQPVKASARREFLQVVDGRSRQLHTMFAAAGQ